MPAVQEAFRFALDPTPRQERMLLSHAGAARFAYNWGIDQIAKALDARQAERAAGGEPVTPIPGHFDLCKAWTAYKNDPANGLGWVGENFVGTYQAALRDAHAAWKVFFDSRSGRRAGRLMGRPRYKTRRNTPPAFQAHGGTVRLLCGQTTVKKPWRKKFPVQSPRLNLPVIGPVRVMCDRHWKWRHGHKRGADAERNLRRARTLARLVAAGRARIVRVNISREPDGLWFASVTADIMPEPVRTMLNAWAQHCAQAGTPQHDSDAWAWKVLPLCADYSAQEIRAALEASYADHGNPSPDATTLARLLRKARKDNPELAQRKPVTWRPPTRRQRKGGTVGVDLGVRELATLSTGETIANPRYLDTVLAQLRYAQQALSRTQEGSRRHQRARQRVAVLHARVRRARRGATIRTVTRLVRRHDHIVVEGWDVQRTVQHGSKDVPARVRRDRNRALADAARGEFRTRLHLAASKAGGTVTVLDPHTPTGRTCSACGAVRDKPVPPAEETFTCPACGYVAPRRLNTARVLPRLAASQAAPSGAETRGGGVRPPGPRAGGRPPSKRAARARPRGRGKTGSPDP